MVLLKRNTSQRKLTPNFLLYLHSMKEPKIIRLSTKPSTKFEISLSWGFNIKYMTIGWGDYGYAQMVWHLFFGCFYITFPWKHKRIKDNFGEDAPSYGVTYHNSSFMFYWKRKCYVKQLPFFTFEWVRTSLLLSDETWVHETKGNRKGFYNKEWTDRQWETTIPYKHITSNEGHIDVNVKCHITEREWRRKWLKRTKIGARINRSVEVEFSDEVGTGRGSYKGGTIGSGFDITKTSDINEGLKKMEKRYNMYSLVWDRHKKIKQILKR